MNATANTRSPPASPSACSRIAVSLTIPARCSRAGSEPGGRQPHSRPRHGSRIKDPLTRDRILAKRRIALLFYESSTRTRTSFELAAKGLGADTTLVSNLSSSIEKGESLKDTGLTLRALGAEAIILRHNSSGAAWLLEDATRLPVLNAGDGMHEHPTQALLDLRTMLTHLRPGIETVTAETLAGVTVTIVGDILHSRVARSNMLLLPRLGARVLLCGPKELLPELAAQRRTRHCNRARLRGGACASRRSVMMLRIQAERLAGLQLDLEEYKAALSAHRPAAGGTSSHGGRAASRTHHSRPGADGRRGRRTAIGDPRASA